MFKVKITVMGFSKDEKKYPCHMRYKIGEEIIYDGETINGRICPSMITGFAQYFKALVASGGRHKGGEVPSAYFPFWHSPLAVYDPAYKKYDGVGFRPTLERPEEKYKFVADETLFEIPPGGNFIIGKGKSKQDVTLTCTDTRTMVRFKIEAFDLADKGDNNLPYYRRAMSILQKVSQKPGLAMKKIIGEFSKEETDNIFPSLGQNIIACLTGELELIGYVDVKDDKVSITDKGKNKLESYKKTLTTEERSALKLQ
jgi:uncharacterized repeat protein (TIGR04076 family)